MMVTPQTYYSIDDRKADHFLRRPLSFEDLASTVYCFKIFISAAFKNPPNSESTISASSNFSDRT